MANKGVKKKKSKYTNGTRIKNKLRKVNKHLKKHPNDKDAANVLNNLK